MPGAYDAVDERMAMATPGRRIVWNLLKGIRNRTKLSAGRIISSSYCSWNGNGSGSGTGHLHQLPCSFINGGWAVMGEQIGNRWMSCCSRLDAPPPRQVTIEYSEEEDNTDYFIQLADSIEEAYPEVMVLGNPEDMRSRRGSFEVTMEGQLLFSKLK
ncbi:hypothetical protein KI387_009527, partial [Taxus chinensis]